MSERCLIVNDLIVESRDRKSTRLNSSHSQISYAVFCLKKKTRRHAASPRGGHTAHLVRAARHAALAPRLPARASAARRGVRSDPSGQRGARAVTSGAQV